MSESRFFVALLPPKAIQDYATEVKSHFAQHFSSRHALTSPPHITLQPPFKWKHDNRSILIESLSAFARSSSPLEITLNGFAAFPPRVIYIDVDRTVALLNLHSALIEHLEAIGISDPREKARPYIPHLTVAFRDLTKDNFRLAWSQFEARSLHFEFEVNQLTLLKHTDQRWIVDAEFPFSIKED